MSRRVTRLALATLAASAAMLSFAHPARAADPKMNFFVTSVNPGKGADFGGLAGADRHCQALAAAAGAGNKTWRAYLSTTASNGGKVVHARDRIGKGPWYNARGERIAKSVDDLHTSPNLTQQTILTERGEPVKGRGDSPVMHDILTGSDAHGRAFPGMADTTCSNWTSSAESGSAQVGHSDRVGIRDDVAAKSWNHAHPSIGCSAPALQRTGGAGLIYCFAAR
jgi:hypothetical protein